jgi:hypothetical protein
LDQPFRRIFLLGRGALASEGSKYELAVRRLARIEDPALVDAVDHMGELMAVESATITTPAGPSAVACGLPLQMETAAAAGLLDSAVAITIEGRIEEGAVSIFLDTEAGLVDEDWLDDGDAPFRIVLHAPRLGDVTKIVVRNILQTGGPSRLEIRRILVGPLADDPGDDRTLTLFYDTNFWTPSFDFSYFLMDAEIKRHDAASRTSMSCSFCRSPARISACRKPTRP